MGFDIKISPAGALHANTGEREIATNSSTCTSERRDGRRKKECSAASSRYRLLEKQKRFLSTFISSTSLLST